MRRAGGQLYCCTGRQRPAAAYSSCWATAQDAASAATACLLAPALGQRSGEAWPLGSALHLLLDLTPTCIITSHEPRHCFPSSLCISTTSNNIQPRRHPAGRRCVQGPPNCQGAQPLSCHACASHPILRFQISCGKAFARVLLLSSRLYWACNKASHQHVQSCSPTLGRMPSMLVRVLCVSVCARCVCPVWAVGCAGGLLPRASECK
jgi:hypothetical protein